MADRRGRQLLAAHVRTALLVTTALTACRDSGDAERAERERAVREQALVEENRLLREELEKQQEKMDVLEATIERDHSCEQRERFRQQLEDLKTDASVRPRPRPRTPSRPCKCKLDDPLCDCL